MKKLLFVCICLWSPAVYGASSWNVTTGDWSVPANWTGGAPDIFAYVNNGGTANITQSQTTAYLYVGGTNTGNVNMTAGTFNAGYLNVGYTGTGTFIQNGGTVISNYLQLGCNTGKTGTYVFNGGTLNASYLEVGYKGTGIFTQTGGLNQPTFLYLGYQGGVGTYNLNGGTLALDTIHVPDSTKAIFNIGGGTFKFLASLPTDIIPGPGVSVITYGAVTHLTGIGGDATFDTNGKTVAIPTIDGTGGLHKTGAGTLILCGPTSYAGNTTVDAGILDLQDAYGFASSLITVAPSAKMIVEQVNLTQPTLVVNNSGNFDIISGIHKIGNVTGNGSMYIAPGASVTANSIVQNSLQIGGIHTIPEPSTFILLIMVFSTLLIKRKFV